MLTREQTCANHDSFEPHLLLFNVGNHILSPTAPIDRYVVTFVALLRVVSSTTYDIAPKRADVRFEEADVGL